MGSSLGPKYIPYTYMDPLGVGFRPLDLLGELTTTAAIHGSCLEKPLTMPPWKLIHGDCPN